MCKIKLENIKEMQQNVSDARGHYLLWKANRIKVGYKPETDEEEEYTEYIEGINDMLDNCESMLSMVADEFYKGGST